MKNAEKRKTKTRNNTKLYYFIMLLPGTLCTFLFITRTWPGILAAFQDFLPLRGWYGSEWIGWTNFKIFFKQPNSVAIIRNTLIIAIGKILVGQFAAIAFALMLNEVRDRRLKKAVQTATYLPHFISWVIYATIIKTLIGTDGLINSILLSLGREKIMFLGMPEIFQGLMILTDTIKEFGFSAIIYLSAITAISPALYEAAEIDGASRWQQTLHVTLPGIKHIIALNAVLNLGNIMNAGFDQIFNMYNTLVMSTGDIIDTWVYRMGLISMNYGVGTAVGLFRSVIAMILTIIAYWAADKFADYKIF